MENGAEIQPQICLHISPIVLSAKLQSSLVPCLHSQLSYVVKKVLFLYGMQKEAGSGEWKEATVVFFRVTDMQAECVAQSYIES